MQSDQSDSRHMGLSDKIIEKLGFILNSGVHSDPKVES
jgi:hypothetical protein